MKKMFLVCLLVLGLILSWAVFIGANFNANKTKDQFPSWAKKIEGQDRFKRVLDNQAALDRETGLVWEISPSTESMDWRSACKHCYQREVGGRT